MASVISSSMVLVSTPARPSKSIDANITREIHLRPSVLKDEIIVRGYWTKSETIIRT